MWEASDEALVAGLAAGDATAALAFVRRFQRRVFGLALLVVRDPGRAEDVAQEAFVRAWRHAGAYDARRASVVTWLLTITRNLAIDAIRVERARPAEPIDVIDLTRPGLDPDPADVVGVRDDVARVAEALDRLPEGQRNAVVATALYGRTARELSESEGIPVGTAKTRIRNGLLKLRDELGVTAP